MQVPKEGPVGVEMLVDADGGAWLIVNEPTPWWKFWRTAYQVSVKLERWGLIWLYQTCAKIMRRGAVEPGFDELATDLRASLSVHESVLGSSMDQGLLERVAATMKAKGWVKV